MSVADQCPIGMHIPVRGLQKHTNTASGRHYAVYCEIPGGSGGGIWGGGGPPAPPLLPVGVAEPSGFRRTSPM